jgi:hypothetical protein
VLFEIASSLRRIVAQAKTRTILRGVASQMGRDDGAYGQPDLPTVKIQVAFLSQTGNSANGSQPDSILHQIFRAYTAFSLFLL